MFLFCFFEGRPPITISQALVKLFRNLPTTPTIPNPSKLTPYSTEVNKVTPPDKTSANADALEE